MRWKLSPYRLLLYKRVRAWFLPASFLLVLSQQIVYLVQLYTDNKYLDDVWASGDSNWYELWRYVTYGFVHASLMHIVSNVAMTLVLAPTLEFIHGPFTVAFVWLTGVLGGGILHSLVDPDIAVIGSSAGVYAILVARLYDVFVNAPNMGTWPLQLLTLFCLGLPGLVDWLTTDEYTSTSHAGHIGGAIGGLIAATISVRSIRNTPRSTVFDDEYP